MNDERVMGVAEMVEDAYLDELADRMERAAEAGATAAAVALDGSAIYRKARKEWTCQCPGNGHQNCPHIMCQQTIKPGGQYVEYLGEASAYQSGTRYCLPCGVATWGFGK